MPRRRRAARRGRPIQDAIRCAWGRVRGAVSMLWQDAKRALVRTDQVALTCLQRVQSLTRRIVLKHPGTALAIGAAACSIMGLLYQHSLLRRFSVNIVDYAEFSDFALSLARHDAVLVSTMVLLALALVVAVSSNKVKASVRWVVLMALVASTPLGFRSLLDVEEKSIRRTCGGFVALTIQRQEADMGEFPRCRIISATASHVFIFESRAEVALAIPKKAILQATYYSRSE